MCRPTRRSGTQRIPFDALDRSFKRRPFGIQGRIRQCWVNRAKLVDKCHLRAVIKIAALFARIGTERRNRAR